MDLLKNSWQKNQSFLCVGLDPDLQKIPQQLKNSQKPLYEFNRQIIDATKDLVCAYKLQIAYYAAQSAEQELLQTIEYIHRIAPGIPVILDSKRGDIGETAEMYAREAFERYQADAVTVNPYMGGETLQPFLNYKDKGVIVLCKTSNPGSGEFQDLSLANGEKVYELVAKKAVSDWNSSSNVMLVVGATQVEPLKAIRNIVGEMPLLVPGVGAQGGDLKQVILNGLNRSKTGLVINSSRAIIYAQGGKDFSDSVRKATLDVVLKMREFM